MPTVAWIAMTPVKGLRLHTVDETQLGVNGVAGDRAFILVDEQGRMVSGTRIGPLVAVVAEHDPVAGTLSLRFPDEPVDGPFTAALSDHCGRSLRLFAMPPQRGGIDRGHEGAATLLGTGSLDALRDAAGVDERVDPRRFRMTFGIDGLAPHEEDGWIGSEVRIGSAVVRVEGNVGRCVFTTRNADTGVVDFKTLHVLERYRGEVPTTEPLPFGVHARVLAPGPVRVGDAVAPQGS
jgi:uncharacterized protein